MALTVTVQNENYPADQVFEVVGLGEFTNGESREVTEEQEKQFVSMYQMPVDERIGEDDTVSVSGTTTIENMDEVLGVDISDTIPAPTPQAVEVLAVEPAKVEGPMNMQAPPEEGGDN